MKTLRNISIIVAAALVLGFANIFSETKAEGVHPKTVKINTTSEAARAESDQTLRDVITGVLNNSSIYESGKVNIVFKVTPSGRVEILNVFGKTPSLVSSVRYAMNQTVILVPTAVEGTYKISASF
jgi:hypothetical protein